MISLTQANIKENIFSQKLSVYSSRYGVASILKSANAYKQSGIPALSILLSVIAIAFQQRSLFMQMKLYPASLPFAKDTFHRFMNSCRTNWRKFTLLLAKVIIDKTIAPLTSDDRINVLIIDDSVYDRSRSKKVELMAKIYDHAKKIYLFGFRMLTLGWSDGNTFLPVSFCLMSTSNKKNRINEADSDIDQRTNGGKQRKLAQRKETDAVLVLLQEAKDAGIAARHVLFDTWFCSPAMLHAVKDIGYHVIAMTKKSSKVFYRYGGKMMDVKKIFSSNKKRRGRSRYLLSVKAEAIRNGKAIPVKLVFVRNRNKRNDYLVLVTTDMELDETEIIRLYGKRWKIEVFFKVCKSYLRLSKECRAISYDAMTAHTAVVFTRYMMLAVENRESNDDRSLGELFYMSVDELADISFKESLRLILLEFATMLQKEGLFGEEELDKLVISFINSLPMFLAQNLRRCS